MKSLLFHLILVFLCAVISLSASTPTVTRDEARLLDRVSEIAQDDVRAALAMLNKSRIGERYSAALDYTAARLSALQDDYEEAADAYRTALDKHPDFTAARAGLGHAEAALSRWKEAEETLHPLVRGDAPDRDVLLLYAHVLIECGRTLSAEMLYRRLLQSEGESPDILLGLARCYLTQKRLMEGTAALESLIRLRPRDRAVWALSADTWLARDRPEKALASLETARRLNIADAPMLVQLGDLYLYRDLPDAAASAYREALEAKGAPGNWTVRAAEGLLLAGDARAAGEWLDLYREREGKPDTGYFRVRALWAERTQDTGTAREAYETWLERDPLNLRALLGMGDLERRDGRIERAELWYERARDAHPRDTESLIRLADSASERRDYRRAADLLEHAYTLDSRPETHQAVIQLRRLAELEGR